MTISTSASKITALGNGATVVFSFGFLIPQSGEEQITYTDALGNQTILNNTQYMLSGFGNPAGGTVTYPLGGSPTPIATGTSLTIARVLPFVQGTTISNQGAFYPQVVEGALDYEMMVSQQLNQTLKQAILAPIVDQNPMAQLPAAAQRAGKYLAFDSNGNPVATGAASTINSLTLNGATSGTLVVAPQATASGILNFPNGNDTLIGRATVDTLTGAKTFNPNTLILAGATSGTTLLNATAIASGTLTLPAATDTLVARNTTDTLLNKTFVAPALGTPASGIATNLTYTPSGTGAVSRTIPSKFGEHISVKDFGAVGDGATDDTTAFQNAFNFIKTLGGGALYLPAPSVSYKISGVTYDDSALTGRFTSRLRIFGDGSASTPISMTGVAANAITIKGNSAYPEMYTHIEGIRITGNSTTGSIGLSLSIGAFCSTDDLVIEAMDYQLDFTDIEQTLFQNSNFRWGNHGVRGNAAVSVTSPNSIFFVNCAIANNAVWGWQITNANAVAFYGGSTQYNGTTGGGTTQWGGKVTEAGNGYGTVIFNAHIFEGNGGTADFISEQSTNGATYKFTGVGFARPNSTSYATNFIQTNGSVASNFNFSGCTFKGYNTYVANAARPYFAGTNTSAKIFDDGTNIYGSATEQPSWAGKALVPVTVVGGTGTGSNLSLQSTSGVGASDFINFLVGNNGGTEAARFTTTGVFLLGSTASYTTAIGAVTPDVQIHGINAASQVGALGIYNWSSGAANILCSRSSGGAVGTRGIVSSGTPLSAWVQYGDDGTNFVPGSEIRAVVDGTPGTNSMPGRLQFSTTTSGASAVTERMRIDSNGFVNILGGSFGRAIATKTTSFTVANTDTWLICNGAATITVTLPAASSFTNRELNIRTIAAFTVVSASSNVVPLAGGAAGTAILAATAGKWATLVSDGTNWQIMASN